MYAHFLAAGHAPARKSLSRRVHRLLAMLFTATVMATFIAFAFGRAPAWLTYAPLPPLLVLMLTGWVILFTKKGGRR